MERFLIAVVFWASLISTAFAQGGMMPGPGTVHTTGGGGTSIAFTTLANGTIGGSAIAGSGTYVSTAPSSISSATWGGTGCSGSSTVTGFSAGSGTWSANFSVPGSGAGGSTCTISITDNLGDSATSPNTTISGAGAIWTLKAHTQFTGTGTNGGTTSAIDCTGANLIVRMVPYYTGGTFTSVSDSSSNSWTPLIGQPGSSGSNGFEVYYVTSPTVSASQTFTVTGTGIFSTDIVECWIDASGTPTFDTGYTNNGATTITSGIHAGQFSYTPTTTNVLVLTGIGSITTVGITYTPDSGFTVTDQAAPSAVHVGGALAYLIETSIVVADPIWTISPAEAGGVGTALFGFKP